MPADRATAPPPRTGLPGPTVLPGPAVLPGPISLPGPTGLPGPADLPDLPDLPDLSDLPEYSRVVVRMPSGERLARLISRCVRDELVVVPLGPRTPDADVARIAERVEASVVVDGERVRVQEGRPDHPEARGLAFIVFTSGSTGEPKGVKLDRDSVFGNAWKVARLHDFGPDAPHATCLPLFHVNAAMMSLLGTMVTGAPLVLEPRFTPAGYFARIAATGARTASVVPALLHRIVEERPPWPEPLDYLITAAAPLTRELAERFYRAYGPRLRQGYGLSEAVNFSFVTPLLSRLDFQRQYVEAHPPVGVPLPGTEFALDDGEVVLRSPDLMRGYWGRPDLTAPVLSADGWLRTGDLGEVRDGLLVLRGRRTEVINRGGEKHHPLDVERQWREAGLTGTFAAVGVDSPTLGNDVGLVLDSGPIGRVAELERVRGLVPVAVDASGLSATSTGKPRRREMAARLPIRECGDARYRALLAHAVAVAEVIAGTPAPNDPAARRVHALAVRLSELSERSGPPERNERDERSERSGPPGHPAGGHGPAHQALDDLLAWWGSTGPAPGPGAAWSEQTAPHRDLVAAVVEARIGRADRALHVTGDLPAPPPVDRFDLITVTGLVEQADPGTALPDLVDLLAPGGLLVVGHVAGHTDRRGTPWALEPVLAASRPRWRSGRGSRWPVLAAMERCGLTAPGYSAVRAPGHDLGGVLWASKPPVTAT